MTDRSSPTPVKVGTTWAALDRRVIYFTDIVYEGEIVDVFPSMEQAEADEGPSEKMRVCRDEHDWYLERVGG